MESNYFKQSIDMNVLARCLRARLVATVVLGSALAACGGGGGGDAGNGGSGTSGSTTNGSGSSAPYVLFASESGLGRIAAFTTLDPTPGTSLLGSIVETVPNGGDSISYDASHDELYVRVPIGVEVFAHASTLVPGTAPARTVQFQGFNGVSAMFLDTANDTLWIAGDDGRSNFKMGVFTHASTLNGSSPADRTIGSVPIRALAVDAGRSILYAMNEFGEIAVYTEANTLNNASIVTPSRSIPSTINISALSNLSIDPGRDILYFANGGSKVSAMHNASSATTNSLTTISFPAPMDTFSATIDPKNDRLYVGSIGSAYALENASTLTTASVTTAAAVQAAGQLIQGFAFP